MKTFTIIYKNDNGTLTDSTRQGKTKKDMKEMYKENGFVVIAVLTASDIEKIKSIDNDTLERQYQLKKYYPQTWWQFYVSEVL